jgi:hypothetical protein
VYEEQRVSKETGDGEEMTMDMHDCFERMLYDRVRFFALELFVERLLRPSLIEYWGNSAWHLHDDDLFIRSAIVVAPIEKVDDDTIFDMMRIEI